MYSYIFESDTKTEIKRSQKDRFNEAYQQQLT